MNIKISPSVLRGEVLPPPSKSGLHRAVICAGLAKGTSRISPVVASEDILATIGAMRALGSRIDLPDGKLIIEGNTQKVPRVKIDAHESGSTLRFMIPVAAALAKEAEFDGSGRLPERPLEPYYAILKEYHRGEKALPLRIHGGFCGHEFTVPGNISSQFVTGLLLAMPLMDPCSRLRVDGTLESRPYVDITIDCMKKFGVRVCHEDYRVFWTEGAYCPTEYIAERDWSAAAFWMVADAIGQQVVCKEMAEKSCQGDRQILDLLKRCGAVVIKETDGIKVTAERLCGASIDVGDIPDLVPILAVLGCFCEGTMEIKNAARLRLKESDRLQTITEGLVKMGAKLELGADRMVIHGTGGLAGGCFVSAYNDHRIAMALAVAASCAERPVVIQGAECIQKSYPGFFEDFRRLGGYADEFNLG